MADTRRPKADLLALWADNATQDISPQDGRDFMVTVFGGYAEIRVADGTTAQTGITTPVIMTGFDTNGASNGLTPDHTNNKITIDIDGVYLLFFQNSFSGGANVTFEFHARVDSGSGYVEQAQGCHRKMSAGGDVGSAGFVALLSLSAGDDVAVYVEASTSASMTPFDAQLILKQIA
jgi:hypothetical protein